LSVTTTGAADEFTSATSWNGPAALRLRETM
jgi:hypothetical protein